jgi:hypothetical protein
MRVFGRSVMMGLGIGLGLLVIASAALCGVGAANDAAIRPTRTAAAVTTAHVEGIEHRVRLTYEPTRKALDTRLTRMREESDAWLKQYQVTLTANPR